MATPFRSTIRLTLEISHGSKLAPPLYNIYTSDIPHNDNITFGTFADDTGIIAFNQNPETASLHLQNHLNQLQSCFIKWRIKINELKSSHISFLLCSRLLPSSLHQRQIPPEQSVKHSRPKLKLK